MLGGLLGGGTGTVAVAPCRASLVVLNNMFKITYKKQPGSHGTAWRRGGSEARPVAGGRCRRSDKVDVVAASSRGNKT